MTLKQAYRGGYNGRPGWWLHLGYDEDVIAYLKAYENGSQRAWDDRNKRWWVSDEIAEQVAVFVKGFEAHLLQGRLL